MDPNNPNTNTPTTPNPTHQAPAPAAQPTEKPIAATQLAPGLAQTVPAPSTQPLQDSAQPTSAPAATKPKSNSKGVFKHWYTWVIIALSFCTVVSVIFAGFALSRYAGRQNQINELSKELEAQKALVAKYAAQVGQIVDDSSHAGYIDGKKVTTQDFIYIGEWGLRFYIPSELTQITYTYKTDVVEGIDGLPVSQTEMLCVTGVPRSATRIPEYVSLGVEGAPLGCVTKQPDNNLGTDSTAKSVYQDGTSYFIYHAPQGVKSVREEDREWEETAIKLIQDLLSRNITKF